MGCVYKLQHTHGARTTTVGINFLLQPFGTWRWDSGGLVTQAFTNLGPSTGLSWLSRYLWARVKRTGSLALLVLDVSVLPSFRQAEGTVGSTPHSCGQLSSRCLAVPIVALGRRASFWSRRWAVEQTLAQNCGLGWPPSLGGPSHPLPCFSGGTGLGS